MKRWLGMLLIVSLALAASWAVAGNGRVEIIKFTLSDQVEWVATCGDYDILEKFDAKVKVKAHYDKDGNLINEMVHFGTDGQSTFYNSEAPEIGISGGPEGVVLKFDYVDGTMTISGLAYKVNVPGVGVLFHQGGHYVCDLAWNCTNVGGPNDAWGGNTDALCEALAP